ASIELGRSTLRVTGVVLGEHVRLGRSHSGEAQATVARATIKWAPWHGMRTGIWISAVVVDEPCLHLRFDRKGNLISHFPASEREPRESGGTIPIARLSVNQAQLVVHQDGRDPFSITNVCVQAEFGDSIQI